MNKGIVVHYKNKYLNGKVEASDAKIDVYCADGIHRVALRVGGDGALRDHSAELGALDKHCLDPIPKNTRVFKLHKDGKIGLAEEAAERFEVQKKLAREGRILSISEYKAKGYAFDKEGNIEIPAPVAPAPQDPPPADLGSGSESGSTPQL